MMSTDKILHRIYSFSLKKNDRSYFVESINDLLQIGMMKFDDVILFCEENNIDKGGIIKFTSGRNSENLILYKNTDDHTYTYQGYLLSILNNQIDYSEYIAENINESIIEIR